MRTLAHIATLLIMGGAFAGSIYIAGTLLDQLWRKQTRDDARAAGTRPVFGKCRYCDSDGHHLHRPSLLLDPEPYCDVHMRTEVGA